MLFGFARSAAMGRRKKVKRIANKRYKIWSQAALKQTGPRPLVPMDVEQIATAALKQAVEDNLPSPIDSPRLGAGKSLQSIARGEEIPQLRAKNFIFSAKAENQVAYERVYKQDRYRGINSYHHAFLDQYSSEHFKYWMLFKGTRWVLMIDNIRDHIKSISIVYGSREHLMFVLKQDRVVWHQRLDGADY